MNVCGDEEALAALYTQRQELLRQLAEVDVGIRVHEMQLLHKNGAAGMLATSDGTSAVGAGGGVVEKVSQLLARSMRDASGLRDAIKLVDACKNVYLMPNRDGATADKVRLRNVFVHEAIAHAAELAVDANGSELMQHLVGLLCPGTVPAVLHEVDYDVGSVEGVRRSEVMLLLLQLRESLVGICCSTNGARVSQRLIDCVTTLEEFQLLTGILCKSMVDLAKDINGNHAVAKLMTSSKFRRLSQDAADAATQAALKEIHAAVYAPIAEHCIEICRNRQGCCIIQKCLQWAPEPYQGTIMNTVLNHTLRLVQDPFGNYVVQFILDRQRQTNLTDGGRVDEDGAADSAGYTNQIIRQMLHHVAELSCNKFSSNVIEKCLKTASPEVRQLLVDELTDPQVLPKLLTDSFANYVIQTAITTVADEDQFTQLRESILPLQNLLKNSPYGVKIEARLSRRHRDSVRRQTRRREGNVHAPPPHHRTPPAPPQEGYVFNNGLMQAQTLSMMAPPETAAMAPPSMAYAKLTSDLNSLFQSQPMPHGPTMQPPPPHQAAPPMLNSMPFVLQGPQGMVSLTSSQPPFAMNVLNGNHMSGEYR